MDKKLRVGWFSFSCCEDSTIIFTELLNDHFQEWKKLIHFVHARVLQTTNVWEEMDVAFVEGAITSQDQEDKLKKIRSLAKNVVAIGACACIGMPSSQRNQFDNPTKTEINFLLERFKYADRVKKLDEVIEVNDKVQGCPMSEPAFLQVINKYLKEFGIIK